MGNKKLVSKLIILAINVFIGIGAIVAWMVQSNSLSTSYEVGEIVLELSSEPETSTNLELSLFSPTFLLDPSIVSLYQSSQTTNTKYLKHSSQFNESCLKITLTLKNAGNIAGQIGYGNQEESQGIDINLLDLSLTDDQNDLAGIVFLIVESDSTEEDYYTRILDILGESSLEYTEFVDLKTTIEQINTDTINDSKVVLDSNEAIQLDIFIWQEYYDLGPYLSQYDNPGKNHIYKKQEFSLEVTVYFGQLGIT